MLITSKKTSFSKLRVLFIQQEFYPWKEACKWSYCFHLAMEEGLWANNVKITTITLPWLRWAGNWAKAFISKRSFDQIWLNDIVHSDINEDWMQWFSTLAPVRFGFITESIKYDPEDYYFFPGLKNREPCIELRLKYFTHIGTLDEKDADEINARGHPPAIWTPAVAPRRYIFPANDRFNLDNPAVFSGTAYGSRQKWLESYALKALLIHPPSPDNLTLYPFIFNILPWVIKGFNKLKLPKELTLPLYLSLLRQVRRKAYIRWLRHSKDYCAIVNLPSLVKGYASHVFEGMSAGCPVISWRVPHRPRTESLFIDDKEILLFEKDDPEQLARQIKRVKTEPGLARRLTENARHKILLFHTIEKRVQQILDWIDTGKIPSYA